MIRHEDQCVGCESMGLHCIGSSCRNRNVPIFICDKCGDEFQPEELYRVGNEDLCAGCILSDYETLEQLNF